jgi:hypothetical protein
MDTIRRNYFIGLLVSTYCPGWETGGKEIDLKGGIPS